MIPKHLSRRLSCKPALLSMMATGLFLFLVTPYSDALQTVKAQTSEAA